jgi:DNA-binding NarL/FixJ family response regulator
MTIRVVICEDQEVVRTGYVTAFDAQPDMAVVGVAADGPAAVEAVTSSKPDVVVMDIHMPLMDGIEVTRRIAGPGVVAPPKVLVVTTFNVDKYVYEALRAGASGFLLKDAPLLDLVNGVRTVARGESLLSPTVTRILIGRFADRLRPAVPTRRGSAGRPGSPRTRGTAADRPWPIQRRDSRGTGNQLRDRPNLRLPDPHQTGPTRPRPSRGLRLPHRLRRRRPLKSPRSRSSPHRKHDRGQCRRFPPRPDGTHGP